MANILVVEDEPNMADLLKASLEAKSHSVKTANDGAQALEILGVEPLQPSTFHPDLILMDIVMPVLDGYSTARRLQEEPSTREIPIIMVSVKRQMKEQFEILPNVKAFVDKPFVLEELLQQVADLVGEDTSGVI